MPTDPNVPDMGRLVRYKVKDNRMRLSQWQAGRVTLCFWTLDAEAVTVDTGRTFVPGIGDPWEYIDAD